MGLGQLSPVDTTLSQVDSGINAAASIAGAVPGIGTLVAGVLKLGEALLNAIGIRRGADEADVITKVQTPLGNQLIAINNAIASASVSQLQTMFAAVVQMGSEFRQFVAESIFTDGRASTQALNTIMPLIDGTGQYTSKNSALGCTSCGPLGPAGSNGTLGSINYQLSQLGVAPMTFPSPGIVQTGPISTMLMASPTITQGQNSGYLPTLESPSVAYGDTIPQAGTLPQYNPLDITSGGVSTVSVGLFGDGYTPLVVGAVLLWLLFRK